jgi:hypothetical protein
MRLRRRLILTGQMLQVLLVLGACSAPSTRPVAVLTAIPSPIPTSTTVPTPSATALPTVAQVGHVAGWQTLSSQHWVGYTFPRSNVTGVRAQWIEPTVDGSSGSEEYIWIGLGGWNTTNNNIIQVGTFTYFPPNEGRREGIWYELVPVQQKAQYPLIAVGPGDQIFASVVQLRSAQRTWQLSLIDVNSGATFSKTVQFHSLNAYPSFIVEDPNKGPPSSSGPFTPFPQWRNVAFSNMQVRIGNAWMPAASLYAYRVQMIRNGKVLATAGPLNVRSSFSAKQG